jgi:hypothetical protein
LASLGYTVPEELEAYKGGICSNDIRCGVQEKMTKVSFISYEIEEGFGFDESRRVYVGGHYPLDVIGGDDVA